MTRAVGLALSVLVTGSAGAVGAWWWTRERSAPPPRSANPPPLPRLVLEGAPLPPLRAPPAPPAPGEGFDAYAARPEDALDVAAGALLLACEDDPTLDPVAAARRFEAWAEEVAAVARAAPDADALTDRFLSAAFGAGGLAFDADDPDARHPDGWRFDRVFDRRIGVCLGLACVVQALADRCGVPCTAVALPGHVCLRIQTSPDRWRNVEVTAQGAARTDAEYRVRHHVPPGAEGTLYLAPCGRRGLLALLCVNVAAWHLDGARPEPALRNAERALRLLPGLPAAHANRATALLRLERWREAVEAADAALAVHPDLQASLVVRGAARLELGEAGGAARDFARALELRPVDLDARTGLARARLGLGEWALAAADFRAVLAARADSVTALAGLVESLWRARRLAEAGPVAVALAERRPDDAEAALLTGEILLALDRHADASAHFARAARLAPDDHRGHRGLGLCALRADDTVAGHEHLVRAAALGADDQELHLLLGSLYRAAADEAAAERHWRRYVALGGERPDVRQWLAGR